MDKKWFVYGYFFSLALVVIMVLVNVFTWVFGWISGIKFDYQYFASLLMIALISSALCKKLGDI